jgi:hypothetical protein
MDAAFSSDERGITAASKARHIHQQSAIVEDFILDQFCSN